MSSIDNLKLTMFPTCKKEYKFFLVKCLCNEFRPKCYISCIKIYCYMVFKIFSDFLKGTTSLRLAIINAWQNLILFTILQNKCLRIYMQKLGVGVWKKKKRLTCLTYYKHGTHTIETKRKKNS